MKDSKFCNFKKIGKTRPIGKIISFRVYAQISKNDSILHNDYVLLEPITQQDIEYLYITFYYFGQQRIYKLDIDGTVEFPIGRDKNKLTMCVLVDEDYDTLIKEFTYKYNWFVDSSNKYRQKNIEMDKEREKLYNYIMENKDKLNLIKSRIEKIAKTTININVERFDDLNSLKRIYNYILNDKTSTNYRSIDGENLGRNYNKSIYLVWGKLDPTNYPKGNYDNYTVHSSGTDEVLGEYVITSCCIDSGD